MNTAKHRQEREAELLRYLSTASGTAQIKRLYKTAMGWPQGAAEPGILMRQEMIPAILDHEFPEEAGVLAVHGAES
jgi:hypothetical protein